MGLEERVLSPANLEGGIFKIMSEEWLLHTELDKRNILILLKNLHDLRKDIESGKKPYLAEGVFLLYKKAIGRFNPKTLSPRNRHLYFRIAIAINNDYDVVERYVYKK